MSAIRSRQKLDLHLIQRLRAFQQIVALTVHTRLDARKQLGNRLFMERGRAVS